MAPPNPVRDRCISILRLTLSGGTLARAAWIAILVGTLLVLINQWEAVIGPQPLSFPKLILTYLVPFLVSLYTSVAKDLQNEDQ